MSIDHDIGIQPGAELCVRFLLMRRTLSVEVVNFVTRYLRSRQIMWSDVDIDLPTAHETDRHHQFVIKLYRGLISDISLCLPDRTTDFLAAKLVKRLTQGELHLPFTNPIVQVFLWDVASETWVSRSMDLFVSHDEYTGEAITDLTLDIIMRILIVIMMTSRIRSDYRLYFVNQCENGQLGTMCVDLTASGQIYIQINVSVSQLKNVTKPTLLITRYMLPMNESVLTCGVCMPKDPDYMTMICVYSGLSRPFSVTPPLNFKCEHVSLFMIDPRISPCVGGIIRRRDWWSAIIMGQIISQTPKRRTVTVERVIREWLRIIDVDYVSHRLMMWYVYHTVLSHTVIIMREKMKASVQKQGGIYNPIVNVVCGMTVKPATPQVIISHRKRVPGQDETRVSYACVKREIAGINHFRVFDYND